MYVIKDSGTVINSHTQDKCYMSSLAIIHQLMYIYSTLFSSHFCYCKKYSNHNKRIHTFPGFKSTFYFLPIIWHPACLIFICSPFFKIK